MAIDILHETLISLRQACEVEYFRNRRSGRPCHMATIHRQVQRGTLGKNGMAVKLEIIRTPSGTCTSLEAIERFAASINGPGAVTTGRHEKDDAESKHQLAEAGW